MQFLTAVLIAAWPLATPTYAVKRKTLLQDNFANKFIIDVWDIMSKFIFNSINNDVRYEILSKTKVIFLNHHHHTNLD